MAKVPKKWINWIVTIILPWLGEYVWPHFKDEIIQLMKAVLYALIDSVHQWVDDRTRAREEAARQRAETAEREARSARTESEADKHRAIAAVWREVAEQFRQESELLKAKLDEVTSTAEADFSEQLNSMHMADGVEIGDDGQIRIPGSDIQLRLPEFTGD